MTLAIPLDKAISDALASQARRTAALLIKRRARDYLAHPRMLEILASGLSMASGAAMIATAQELLTAERATRRRFAGLFAEPPAINYRAVWLLGRAMRRRENAYLRH